MPRIQGVEVLSPEDNEALILKQVNKDTISKFGSHITRRVVTTGLRIKEFEGLPLGKILRNVDNYFDTLSHSIGGSTVQHNWCLIPTSMQIWELEQIDIEGFMLAARTQVVKGKKIEYAPKGSLYDLLREKLADTSTEFLDKYGWYVPDTAKPHQFLLDDKPYAKPTLVDIEPRIETNTYPPPQFDLL